MSAWEGIDLSTLKSGASNPSDLPGEPQYDMGAAEVARIVEGIEAEPLSLAAQYGGPGVWVRGADGSMGLVDHGELRFGDGSDGQTGNAGKPGQGGDYFGAVRP